MIMTSSQELPDPFDPESLNTDLPHSEPLDIYAPVYAFVKTVPPGSVVTYGQVAALITEVSLTARQVGTAMKYAPPDVPWQRVVGAGGTMPVVKLSPEQFIRQKQLLTEEGVGFVGENGARVDMKTFQWQLEEQSGLEGDRGNELEEEDTKDR